MKSNYAIYWTFIFLILSWILVCMHAALKLGICLFGKYDLFYTSNESETNILLTDEDTFENCLGEFGEIKFP